MHLSSWKPFMMIYILAFPIREAWMFSADKTSKLEQKKYYHLHLRIL